MDPLKNTIFNASLSDNLITLFKMAAKNMIFYQIDSFTDQNETAD